MRLVVNRDMAALKPGRFIPETHACRRSFGEVAACVVVRPDEKDYVMLIDRTCETNEGLSAGIKEYAVVKRSVVVGGHKTSVSLEDAFWTSLKDIATRRGITLSSQIDTIDRNRRTSNLSSAIRLFVLEHFRTRAISTMFIGERQSSPSIVPAE